MREASLSWSGSSPASLRGCNGASAPHWGSPSPQFVSRIALDIAVKIILRWVEAFKTISERIFTFKSILSVLRAFNVSSPSQRRSRSDSDSIPFPINSPLFPINSTIIPYSIPYKPSKTTPKAKQKTPKNEPKTQAKHPKTPKNHPQNQPNQNNTKNTTTQKTHNPPPKTQHTRRSVTAPGVRLRLKKGKKLSNIKVIFLVIGR